MRKRKQVIQPEADGTTDLSKHPRHKGVRFNDVETRLERTSKTGLKLSMFGVVNPEIEDKGDDGAS